MGISCDHSSAELRRWQAASDVRMISNLMTIHGEEERIRAETLAHIEREDELSTTMKGWNRTRKERNGGAIRLARPSACWIV